MRRAGLLARRAAGRGVWAFHWWCIDRQEERPISIHYGTAPAEQIIRGTQAGLRVGFATTDVAAGTETLYALHPVTRDIRVRHRPIGEDGPDGAAWGEAHYIPPGAMYVGRCASFAETARVSFAA
ncbi:MAG: hypothetical protein KDK11_16290 [Maritimibacter sp.]|nr:hypothetical protein [Maritimibacter sp.]